MDNNIIGVFDSGVGGLTVFSKLIKKLPEENYVYYGDTQNIPYGNKTKEELINLTQNIFDFYSKKNAKAVVMACNTTSAITYDILKNNYDFLIYPVTQIAAKFVSSKGVKRIGVLSTEATAKSHAYKNAIQKENPEIEVIELACPGWVEIVENNTLSDLESIELIKINLLEMLKNEPEIIILGCTHYPFLKQQLIELTGKDIFLDPAESFVNYISDDLKEKNLLAQKRTIEPEFFVSSNPAKFKEAAKLFYELDNIPTIA